VGEISPSESTLVCLAGRVGGKFVNLLLRLGYETLSDLAAEKESSIAALPGCGPRTIALLRGVLADHGLSFAQPARVNILPRVLAAAGPRLRLVKS
jgi:hypothetical protein